MKAINQTVSRSQESVIASNRVLKNTYMLLSLTLLFSAAIAGVSMVLNLPHPGIIITLVGYFGLFFLTNRLKNSVWGIASVFALTGFMGYTLGPILSMYVNFIPNGTELIVTALGGTGLIFVGLSAYVLNTKKDFSFLSGMLFTGILVAFLAGLGAIFFEIPSLSIAVSAMFVLLMSGMILFQTSEIIHGGETNYVMATVSLYITIYNLFLSLLQLLGIFGSDD